MPDRRQHRGPHPKDPELFAPATHPPLRSAVGDLAWLLGRGYAARAALKLVGDRYQLSARQRQAVASCTCTDEEARDRARRIRNGSALRGQPVAIDGFNCVITVETALSGGLVLRGRDRAHRDLSSIHGSYRRIQETARALQLIGEALAHDGAGPITWLLDRPVSNSGRLRGMMLELAGERGWTWTVELIDQVDQTLCEASETVATSDSRILDACAHWTDLTGAVIARSVPDRWLLDLGAERPETTSQERTR